MDGVLVETYLWAGRTVLLAVIDPQGNVKARFDGPKVVLGGVAYYQMRDQVGSLRALVDTSGAVVKSVEYDAFGQVVSDSNPGLETYVGFAGGLQDRDTGLVRFGFRDYLPDVGRWTARDPIGIGGGDWDLYAYCESNPANCRDPDGLSENPLAVVGSETTALATQNDIYGGGNKGVIIAAKRIAEWYRQAQVPTTLPALRPESKYLQGKKHGIHWSEGLHHAKAKRLPQGQWGSTTDLEYAGQKAATLEPSQWGDFELPEGSKSVVHTTDGRTVPATHFRVRNNGSGTFHGYPILDPCP